MVEIETRRPPSRLAAWVIVKVAPDRVAVMSRTNFERGPKFWGFVSAHRSRYTAEFERERIMDRISK